MRNVLYLHLLCTGATYSQRNACSFGPTIDLSLGYTPIGLVRSSSAGTVAVLAQETPTVYFYTVTPNGTFLQTDLLELHAHVQILVSDPDPSTKGFGFLSTDGEVVSVVQQVNGMTTSKQFQLQVPSQRVVYGDMNSDRRNDLLLFGKKRTGITPLLKQKDSNHVIGPVVFPDISISDVRSTDLNGDGITDLFVLNWLSNELALFYGIGRGVFSEQVAVSVPGEPANIAISPVTKARTMQIAVTVPEERIVCTYLCNATGEVDPIGTFTFSAPPLFSEFADVNSDKWLDLIVTTQQSLYVILGTSSGQMKGQTPFGGGAGIISSVVTDLDGDLRSDLVAIDRTSKRVLAYGNSDWKGSVEWPSTYAVGSYPKGIAVFDANHDGLEDIVVANSGSSTLSVLLNRGGRRLFGQQVIPVTDMPVSVIAIRSSLTKGHIAVMCHEKVDKVSVLTLADDITTHGVFTLPTGSNPHIVLMKQDSVSGQLELLTRYTNPRDGSPSLSQFSQIGTSQFLERSLRASIPGKITALTVGDYSGSGKHELVFVTNDKVTHNSTLSIAFPGQGFDYRSVKPLLTFTDSTASVHSILSGYVDGDSYKDVVLLMSAPRNAVGLVYGKGGAVFGDTLEVVHNVQPLDEEAFLIQDVNNDGYTDMTWIDTGRSAVITMYGRGRRKFDQPASIRSGKNITAIHIASLELPNIQDLVLAHGSKGFVTILLDPFK